MSCFTCDEFVGLVAFRVAALALERESLMVQPSSLPPKPELTIVISL